MHLGIIQLQNGSLKKAQYFKSAWDRELDEMLTINGEKFKVGIIGETKADVIEALNKIIKAQNKIVNRANYQTRKAERAAVAKMFAEAMRGVQNDLKL